MEAFSSSLSLLPCPPAVSASKHSSLMFSHGLFPTPVSRCFRVAATAPPPPSRGASGMIMASSVLARRTLSEGWNLSASGSAWLPRFDELDTTNMLLRQRIVFLGSQVDDMTADLIVSQLLFLDAEDQTKDIKLFINSPGGSVTSGISHTTDMGLRIREMMYHKVKMNKIFSRITGKPEHQIEIDTDRDNFMNPWEAKEYGLVDSVIDDGKPGLVAPIADSTPPPKTRVWDLWKIEGSKKAKKNLPSELNLSQNGYGGNEDKGREQAKEMQAPV
ncbi:hypothetical protein KFK09_025873 [Dendrobium nobile]|uniref:ATP-dependent Clp protease proteolytic subunit n=1 Tax=Dendrobium nobile TaxID=94219 RepID=A0A8T3A6A3_DENNO|nr:hypothetical protein KFK09_025873 [Dendrobium nobile]